MNIFSALWITEMCFHAKWKTKTKKPKHLQENSSLSTLQGLLSQKPTCAYAITV